MSSAQYFRIRNQRHKIEGTYSEKEILKRIEAGKYEGDEEVSPAPYTDWQKLSSHPLFYDAFLRRLFKGEYRSVSRSDLGAENKVAMPRERATRQIDVVNHSADNREENNKLGAGTQHGKIDEKDAGATIHQSAIDALFEDEVNQNEGEKVQQPGTHVIKIEMAPDARSVQAASLDEPLDFAGAVADEEQPELLIQKAKRERNRRVFIAAGLAVLLSLLFVLGKTDGNRMDSGAPSNAPYASTMEILDSLLTKEEKIKSLVREGDQYLLADDGLSYASALASFREANKLSGSVSLMGEISEALARLLPYSANRESGITEIKRLISEGRKKDPTFDQFYRSEALVALSEGKFSEAQSLIQAADEADPQNAENYLVIGEVQYELGQKDAALETLERVNKATPECVRSHYLVAKIYLDNKNYPEAKTRALETIRLNPFHAPTYKILGDISLATGDSTNAMSYFETAGRLAPFSFSRLTSDTYYNLGNLLESSGNHLDATNSYLLSYHYDESARARLREKLGGQDLSEKNLNQLAHESAYAKSYFMSQAASLVREGNPSQALQFYRGAFLLDPKDSEALVKMGQLMEEMAASIDDFQEVMLLYERSIRLNPNNPDGYIQLGLLETAQYRFDQGYRLLDQAVSLAPDRAEPYVAMGKHFYLRQDYNQALPEFLKAVEIDKSNAEIFYYAGLLRLLGKENSAKTAMESFEKAYTLDSLNYDALMQWLRLKTQNYEKNFAIRLLKGMLERDPRNPKLYWVFGEVYAADKEYRRAIEYYKTSLNLDNRSSKVRASLAEALQSVGDYDNAIEQYRIASQLDRRYSEGLYKAADLEYQMHRYKQAELTLKSLVKIAPNYPGLHRYLSKIYQTNHQRDLAIAEMKQEVSNNPQDAKFKIELAELYIFFEKYDEAVSVLTEVTNLPSVKNAPEYLYDKIRSYLLLSRCYRYMGRPESAEAAISLALDLDGEDPELHRELGYVYYAEQRDQLGVKEFQYYLNRNPAAQDAESIRGLIQQMEVDD